MKNTQTLLFSFACLLLTTISSAQNNLPNYKFHTQSPKGGLGYEGVKAIKQDSEGFIWILMENELVRFDGFTYKRFSKLIIGQKNYNSFMSLREIEEDNFGRLFIATTTGLFVQNKHTDKFEKWFDGNFQRIKKDVLGVIWVVNEHGINTVNIAEKKLELIHSQRQSLSVNTIISSDKSHLIMGNGEGNIYKFDTKQHKFLQIITLPINCNIVDIKNVSDLILVLTENQGLWVVDLKSNSIVKNFTFFCQPKDERVPARSLFVDKRNKVWVGTQKGLYELDIYSSKFRLFTHSESDIFSLVNNSVWVVTGDNENNMWIGTFSCGISYVNFNETTRFKTNINPTFPLNGKTVSAFAEASDKMWIGTEGNGLYSLDKSNGAILNLIHDINKNSIAYDNIKALLITKNQYLWIGMFRGGLDCLNLKTGNFQHYNSQQTDKRIQVNHIHRLEAESDSGIWVGYKNEGNRLTYFSLKSKKSDNYMFNKEGKTELLGTDIRDIARDDKSNLYIATQYRLHIMDVRTRKVNVIPIDSDNDFDFINMNIQTIFWDNYHKWVWIGTNDLGLIKYNTVSKKFEYHTSILSFDMHSIYSINSDDEHNLWLGTDNGLFKFDIKTNCFLKFNKADGIQGNVFYPRSTLKLASGELYFGGNEGYSIINPVGINARKYLPKVLLCDFFIDNEVVTIHTKDSPLKESLATTKEITLKHFQANFGFEFSSTNFLLANKTKFKCRLVGYDNNWIEVNAARRYVSYSKVPSGKYTFEIKASNEDGVWNEIPRVVNIHVIAAPWNSWWSYLLYFLIFASFFYLLLSYYLKTKKLQLELYLESTEKEREKENNNAKLQFFTNISHEFKTPLSLIIATLDRLKQDIDLVSNRHMTILGNNAKRLLNLINELMDFRTVENGNMPLKIAEGSFNDFVKMNASDFQEYATQRNIKFEMKFDVQLNSAVFFDYQLVEKILMNLLNNAMKYTNDGGKILIETYSDITKFHSSFTNQFHVNSNSSNFDTFGIVVSDSGIGISKESIGKVFDRFYMVNDHNDEPHLGSGVGLALVKSLVLLHKGEISIFSEREKGTDIVIALPRSKSIYNSTEFLDKTHTEIISPKNDVFQMEEVIQKEQLSQYDNVDFYQNEKKRILLAEDNDDLRHLIAEMLSTHYDICQAVNGKEATDFLAKMEIDLIISDIMMPIKDGVSLCKDVKADISTSHIPFILMTAKDGLENRIEGIDSGADAYLEKPVNSKVLLLTIKNLFIQQNNIKEFYSKNFFTDQSEGKMNQRENEFMNQLLAIIDKNIDKSSLDVNSIAVELAMNKSKLYSKVKSLTGKSIVEFIRHYRLRRAVKLLVDDNLSISEVMHLLGFESQSYFTKAFKQEFGENPSTFIANAKRKH